MLRNLGLFQNLMLLQPFPQSYPQAGMEQATAAGRQLPGRAIPLSFSALQATPAP